MEFINAETGTLVRHHTAKEIAYLYVEGVNMLASSKEWKRINKRVRKMGLGVGQEVYVDEVTSMFCDILLEECNLNSEVDLFLEEMCIMGMLEEPDDDDDDNDE